MTSATTTQPTMSLQTAAELHEFVATLYPICRSITGAGIRHTLDRIAEHIPLTLHHVPSGTQVLDWTVPREWNIHDAYIKNMQGERIVDFRASSLHVVSYSTPIHRVMGLGELREHLWSLPEQPDWVPYRTSYYNETWGFCLSHNQLQAMQDEQYEVCIDSSLAGGHLTYGECVVSGTTADEVLISCHCCHPALCNDNLSGIAVATALAERLRRRQTRYTYRFIFIPATIGAITWLARNRDGLDHIKHGLVLSCAGDPGNLTYKRSRRGDAEIDRAVQHVLRQSGKEHTIVDFSPYGYDERQYCSPGFNLPVGCLSRTPHGRFPEYHTSADDLSFVTGEALADTVATCLRTFEVLEHNRTYLNLQPWGEPQLGRRGLYRTIGGQTNAAAAELAMLWVLNQSDGTASLLQIAERSGLPIELLSGAAQMLLDHDLLREQISGEAGL